RTQYRPFFPLFSIPFRPFPCHVTSSSESHTGPFSRTACSGLCPAVWRPLSDYARPFPKPGISASFPCVPLSRQCQDRKAFRTHSISILPPSPIPLGQKARRIVPPVSVPVRFPASHGPATVSSPPHRNLLPVCHALGCKVPGRIQQAAGCLPGIP